MRAFTELVRDELIRARTKNKPFNSLHEGYAVLLEEVDELWDEIKKKPAARLRSCLLAEVVQVAAMAQRFAEDCLEVEREEDRRDNYD